MPALSEMPYLFAVPDATDEEVQEACYELFATSQGQLVLNRLYWKVMMRSPGDLREVGEQCRVLGRRARCRLRPRRREPRHSALCIEAPVEPPD